MQSDLILSVDTQEIADFLSRNRLPRVTALEASTFTIPTTDRVVAIREILNDPTKEAKLKVAYAQIKTEPGAFEVNTAAHIAAITAAYERGCTLVQFPEMSLPNYCSLDLLLDRSFLKAQERWLQEIVDFSNQTPGLTSVVGFVDVAWEKTRSDERPWSYNSLAVIRDGEVIEVIHKKLLPNYAVFDEVRWYESEHETKIVDINGVKVGFLVCEDIWTQGYDQDPVKSLVDAGAEYLSHSAASPNHVGKNATRAGLATEITDKYQVPFGSVNMVGCHDGYEGDLPFDGRGLVRSADGEWVAMGTPFTEELLIVDPFAAPAATIPDLLPVHELLLSAVESAQSYIKRMDKIIGTPTNIIIGNSGGIDCAVNLAVAVLAVGPDRVLSISLPSEYNTSDTRSDAAILAHNLKIKHREISIQEFYQAGLKCMEEAVSHDPTSDNRVGQNLQARIRTTVLMGFAQAFGGIMLNTGNKTERFTNNFTMYGDSAGNIALTADWDKDRMYEVAEFINEVFGKLEGESVIPETTIQREASAELGCNQVDAHVMGGKPEVISPYLRNIIESRANDFSSARKITPESIPDHLIRRWINAINASEWKGRQITPATRVTPLSAGFNRRIPINHHWKGQLPN